MPARPRPTIATSSAALEREHRSHRGRPPQFRNRGEREHRAAHRQRQRARERHQPVVADEEARRGEPVDRQQRGHRREGGPDQHRAAVAAAGAGERQRHRRGGREAGADRRSEGSGRPPGSAPRSRRRNAPRQRAARRSPRAGRAATPPAGAADGPCDPLSDTVPGFLRHHVRRGDRLRSRGPARRSRATATPGSSCCGPSSRRASASRSCARPPRTTGWRCCRWSACSRARESSTRARSWPRRPASTPTSSTRPPARSACPVREPGERAITEEELELSRSAKALLDAGLSPESFLELTAVMSRSMQNIAASLTSVFGEAFLQPGDTERDLGLRYAEALREPRPARRADAPAHAQPAPARADARGGDQPGRAPERAPGRARSRSRSGFVDIVGLHQARRGRGAGGPRHRGAGASSARSPTPWSRRCGS